ncbi:MAG: hypothetical protein FVQ84_08605 [Planctomycetes bacterium]|nr:hypothetical protein [Planctomycetota bacterium]
MNIFSNGNGNRKNPFSKKRGVRRVALMIEDDKVDFISAVSKFLQRMDFQCDLICNVEQAYQMMDLNYYEMIFCVENIPDFDLGIFLSYTEKRFPAIKFVLVGDHKNFLRFKNVTKILKNSVSLEDLLQPLNS